MQHPKRFKYSSLKGLTLICWVFCMPYVSAQHHLDIGQRYLDSLTQLNHDSNWQNIAVYDTLLLKNGNSIFSAEIIFDCFGDICYDAKKGLITKDKKTVYPDFDNIQPLNDDQMILTGGKYGMIIKHDLTVKEVFSVAMLHDSSYFRIKKRW